MKLKWINLLLTLFLAQFVYGQTIVSGTVSVGEDNAPAPFFPVEVVTDVGDLFLEMTDEDGNYTIEIENIDPNSLNAEVSVHDFCSGEALIELIELIDGATIENVNFHICQDIEPPVDSTDICEVYFIPEYIADDLLTVHFQNVSFLNPEATSWDWNFGDGNTSNEESPTHTYEEEGTYLVTLTGSNGVCDSSFDLEIVISENNGGCDCPWDEYDPVCVEIEIDSTQTTTIEFPSACFAECAGYSADDFVDCEPNNGDCFVWFEANPVYDDSTDLIDTYTFVAGYPDILEIESWSWDFGDGNTSDEENPTHSYDEPGVYDVVLTITTVDGCTSTFLHPVFVDGDNGGCDCPEVYEPVCVEIAIEDTDETYTITFPNACFAECEGYTEEDFVDCEPNNGDCFVWFDIAPIFNDSTDLLDTYTFIPNTFDNIIIESWSWDFGDGNTSNEESPTHTYDEEGVYDVVLTITTADGCTSSFSLLVFVDGENGGCGCPEIYAPVCVEVEIDPLGNTTIIEFSNACFAECEGYTEEDFVDCEPNNNDCFVWFDAIPQFDDSTDVIDTYAFMATYPDILEIESWSWDFGDGNTSDEENPTHTYEEEGTYQVTLTTTTVDGCTSSFALPVFVGDGNGGGCDCPWDEYDPVCVEIVDEWTGETYIITFPNACFAECEGYAEDDFVDCTDNGGCDCEYIFDPVCVEVELDSLGGTTIIEFPNACWAECEGYTEEDFVDCEPNNGGCFVWFDVNQLPNVPPTGTSFSFDVYYPDNIEIVSWAWDFGDGNTSDEESPVHTYMEDGVFDITLTITTADGCTSTAYNAVCIGDGGYTDLECEVFFWTEQDDNDSSTFTFHGESMSDDVAWHWDFGDGNTSDEQNPTHTYTEAGTYEVMVTVYNNDCESSMLNIVVVDTDIVYETTCLALFLPLPADIPGGNDNVYTSWIFMNFSSPDAESFAWDFGDGNTSTEQVPVHTFAEAGTYDVSLTITTADGCTNSYVATLTIGPDGIDVTGNPSYLQTTSTSDVTWMANTTLSPNPVHNFTNIDFTLDKAGDCQLNILAIDGRIVSSTTINATKGQNTHTVDASNLEAGMYFINITNGGNTKTLKMIKQ